MVERPEPTLAERVSFLEGRLQKAEQKTLLERVSLKAGLLALLISISLGAYNLLDALVLKPSAQRIAAEAAFRERAQESIVQLAQVSLDFEREVAYARDREEAQNFANYMVPYKELSARRALGFFRRDPTALAFPDKVFLANILFEVGDDVGAREVIETLERFQHSIDEYMSLASLRALSEMRFPDAPEERIVSAVDILKQALETIERRGATEQEMFYLHFELFHLLSSFERCDSASDVYEALVEISSKAPTAPMRLGMLDSIASVDTCGFAQGADN